MGRVWQRRGLDGPAVRLACRFGHGHGDGMGRHLVHTRVGGACGRLQQRGIGLLV